MNPWCAHARVRACVRGGLRGCVRVCLCLCCDCRLTVAAPRLCRPRAQRWLGARRLSTPGTIVRWRGDIAGAPERARWAGARALCRVLRRVRVFDSAWWWIPVDSRVVLSCELFLYVWFLQVYFLRGRRRVSRRSPAIFACAFCVVCAYMRLRVCACACVSSCKMCARVRTSMYVSVRTSVHACGVFVCVREDAWVLATRACVHVRGC